VVVLDAAGLVTGRLNRNGRTSPARVDLCGGEKAFEALTSGLKQPLETDWSLVTFWRWSVSNLKSSALRRPSHKR
jgi:hypothetical protein